MREYLIHYEEIERENIIKIISTLNGLPLSEMKMTDLIFYREKPILRGCGVYVFKHKNIPIYVGSCVSRSFIERVPSHLDIRKVGWFNSLLKIIIKLKMIECEGEYCDEHLVNAAEFALKEVSIILINFKTYEQREAITRLEDYLIRELKTKNRKPSLKRFKTETI